MRKQALIFLLLFSVSAQAHDPSGQSDWIGNHKYRDPFTKEQCCGWADCVPLPDEDVAETKDGYFIKHLHETVPLDQALPSEDGRYWRCHKPTGERRCFFRPPGTS